MRHCPDTRHQRLQAQHAFVVRKLGLAYEPVRTPARPSRNIAWAGRQREEWKRIYQLFQRLEELAAQRR